jgi:hypothetical protein
MKLLICEKNWADEFDTHGFMVVTDKQWDYYQKVVNALEYPQEVCFGSNECHEFNSPNDFFRSIKVVEITKEESDILIRLFSGESFGENLLYCIEESLSDEVYEELGPPPKFEE